MIMKEKKTASAAKEERIDGAHLISLSFLYVCAHYQPGVVFSLD